MTFADLTVLDNKMSYSNPPRSGAAVAFPGPDTFTSLPASRSPVAVTGPPAVLSTVSYYDILHSSDNRGTYIST